MRSGSPPSQAPAVAHGILAIFQASPTGADGRVFCISLRGEVVVVSAGDAFKVLHRVEMGGRICRASIAAAAGQLLIRTDDRLYCIGRRR